jgi:hypothetical protein
MNVGENNLKVKIGPYKDRWVGPYQIANALKIFGVSEDKCHDIGTKLSETPLNAICEWIHAHDPWIKRKVKVKIDAYDTWSMDHTLSLIILPMLIQLKETKHGAPYVEDSDVPDALKSTAAPKKEHDYDTDENHFKRWDWVLDEMINAFDKISDDSWEGQYTSGKGDYDGLNVEHKRISNGLRLFGTYFQGLWD